ncbi:MAG TPA: ankyrin repeat domain-containing protein, partial [Alphaproteobacteria bacterium]|nr:ankyrin repeat domain-containing protein [Alphaproteobacteria bacterium]
MNEKYAFMRLCPLLGSYADCCIGDQVMAMTETEIRYLDAAKAGDFATVKAMLAAGAEIDTRDDRQVPKGRTALMHAASIGHLEIVDLLLKMGANLEATDKGAGFDWPGRNTPLILAIKNKHIKVANRLLDAGANPKAKSVDTTALRSAVEIGEFGLVKRLIQLGADPAQAPTDRISAMLEAIYDDNAQAVELFLENGADPNARTPGRSYLISGAVHKGNLKICQLLHSHGASLNVRDDDYRFTPLMTACIWSHNDELFRFLLSAGAEVNAVNI